MTARVTTQLAVSALVRRVDAAGGSAVVIARGDRDSGTILLLVEDRGRDRHILELGYDSAGKRVPVRVGPQDGDDTGITAYWQRRRDRDPDLWVVEVNVAAAERFAAETIWVN